MTRKPGTVKKLRDGGIQLAALRRLKREIERADRRVAREIRRTLGRGRGARSYKDDQLSVSSIPREALVVRERKLSELLLSNGRIARMFYRGVLVVDPYRLQEELGDEARPYLRRKAAGYETRVHIRDPDILENQGYIFVGKQGTRGVYDILTKYAKAHPQNRDVRRYIAHLEKLLGIKHGRR